LAIVAWNPVQEAADRPPKAIELSLPWDGGPALARRRRVHEGAGNPWGLWAAMGRPRFPDAATVDFLKDASRPELEVAVLEPEGALLALSFTLRRNEVTLLEISPFADESPSYLGLDDSLIDGYHKITKRQGGLS
jgi:xylan 1,4-beta-xylosidase